MAFDTESTLSVTVKSHGEGLLIVPHGDLDEETTATFGYCLADALESRCTPIRVDLSKVSFIDLTGYQAIMRFADRCQRRNVVTEWLRPSSSVELMFLVLGPPPDERFAGANESDLPPGVAAAP